MSTTLAVRETTPAGKVLGQWSLEVASERVTVRDVIRSQVYQGYRDWQVRDARQAGPTAASSDLEQRLNPKRAASPGSDDSLPDWHAQFDKAVKAFEAGQILVLVDDRQAESLDEPIDVRPETVVTFVRLVLLAGG